MLPASRPMVFLLRSALVALPALAGLLLSSACAEITRPNLAAEVEVRVPFVVQAEMSPLTDFTVDGEIVNIGSAIVLYDRWCNWRIQQLVNGSWAPAYTPLCSAEGRDIYQLWPGERAVHRYAAHRSWRTGNGAQVPGTYRLVMSVFSGEAGRSLTELDETVVASNSFTVR